MRLENILEEVVRKCNFLADGKKLLKIKPRLTGETGAVNC
ncbi:hypothetical protein NIES22_28980 [Calothrix brevissima NIES-22]|nr:hypothetical protein NIES22_28980 [Calothrix brevissima NIES-22]